MRKTGFLVLGGAHVDRRGRIAGETAPGASNPGTWFVEAAALAAGVEDTPFTVLDRTTPSAMSRLSEPVGIVSISTTLSLAPSFMIEPLP